MLDRLAASIGIWSLRRLYGADCKTDIRDDFPNETDIVCLSCEAKRLVNAMKEFLKNG